MNYYIEKQLKELGGRVDIIQKDENTLILSKNLKPCWKIGGCYLIQLDDILFSESDTFTYHTEWGNKKPLYKHIKCECNSIMGENVKVYGSYFDMDTGTDINQVWVGWLPTKYVTIVEEL